MFCPHCGFENTEDTRFCSNCGKDVNEASDKELTPSQTAKLSPQESYKLKKGNVSPQSKPSFTGSNPISYTPGALKQPKQPKAPKVKKEKDYVKLSAVFKKASVISLIALILSFTLSVGSLAFYFVKPDSYEDKLLTPPEPVELADPTYDTNAIAKDAMAAVDPGDEATDTEAKQLTTDIKAVEDTIKKGIAEAKKADKTITDDDYEKLHNYITSALYELEKENKIYDYYTNDYTVTIELNSGIYYVYSPEIEGVDAGVNGTLKVGTYQPCVSSYGSALSTEMTYPDTSAEKIEATFPMYEFDGDKHDYNDNEVSLASLYETTGYNVLLWHGHGGYSSDLGSLIVTGIPRTEENHRKYYSLLKSKCFALSKDSFVLTYKFIENCIDDNAYDNTIVYLGACSSGYTSDLADAFLEKGAEAVYANSGIIHTQYNLNMIKSTVDALCTKKSDGSYNNVTEALEVAQSKNGESDTGNCKNTYVRLFTNNPTFTLDWYEDYMLSEREVVLVLDDSGSMSGTPATETRKAANTFVDNVIAAKATVSVVTFDNSAKTLTGFTSRKATLTNAIETLYGNGGGTNIHAGLEAADSLLENSKAKKKIIILMTDGEPNDGYQGQELIDYAQTIKDKGIYIYSLGFFQSLNSKSNAQWLLTGIASSGCYHDIADASEISYVFDDISTEISGERRIFIRVACPVDVEITYKGETLSKDNPRTSFGSLSIEEPRQEDIESDENYDSEADNTIKTVRLTEGLDYDVKIEGTGKGKMDYTIGFMDENNEYTDMREFNNIKITKNTEIETKAVYAVTSTLLVDEDGDGETDLVYRAERDSRAEKKEISLDWRLLAAIICGCVFIVSLAVFIPTKKAYKSAKAKIAA